MKILAQGSRDGACFLYSLANAAQGLTGQVFSEEHWTAAIRAIWGDLGDFLSGRGTEKIDHKPFQLAAVAKDFLSAFEPGFAVEWIEPLEGLAALEQQVAHDSVFILEINDGAHWIAVMDVAEGIIFSACSAMALQYPKQYREVKSPHHSKRWCNREDSFRQLKVGKGRGLRVFRR